MEFGKITDRVLPVAQKIAEQGLEASKSIADATIVLGESHVTATQIAADALKTASEAALEATTIATEGVVVASRTFGSEAIAKVIPALGAAAGIYSFYKLGYACADIYAYFYPSEEKKALINKAREKNRFFEAKQEFRACLMKNGKSPRNVIGRPCACEDLANVFAMVSGESELDSMTTTFQRAYKA